MLHAVFILYLNDSEKDAFDAYESKVAANTAHVASIKNTIGERSSKRRKRIFNLSLN